jgi:hypothetical protein
MDAAFEQPSGSVRPGRKCAGEEERLSRRVAVDIVDFMSRRQSLERF